MELIGTKLIGRPSGVYSYTQGLNIGHPLVICRSKSSNHMVIEDHTIGAPLDALADIRELTEDLLKSRVGIKGPLTTIHCTLVEKGKTFIKVIINDVEPRKEDTKMELKNQLFHEIENAFLDLNSGRLSLKTKQGLCSYDTLNARVSINPFVEMGVRVPVIASPTDIRRLEAGHLVVMDGTVSFFDAHTEDGFRAMLPTGELIQYVMVQNILFQNETVLAVIDTISGTIDTNTVRKMLFSEPKLLS